MKVRQLKKRKVAALLSTDQVSLKIDGATALVMQSLPRIQREALVAAVLKRACEQVVSVAARQGPPGRSVSEALSVAAALVAADMREAA